MMNNNRTTQSIFDTMWNWFVVDKNPRCINEYGSCVYRSADGLKCAIGMLIPDEEYASEIEGHSLGSMVNGLEVHDMSLGFLGLEYVAPPPLPPTLHKLVELGPNTVSFLKELQLLHDSPDGQGSYFGQFVDEDEFRAFAGRWSLDIPIVGAPQ